ncbi:nuclear transport factor 2 family protein [Rhodoferax sp. U11-2br]|uniref:nuclear transport factor 2 family protein n=1 Tax=Rhodoferax sp. U11-2br TaxID=2838878 RepID=UPI001BE90F36|nr:nuclear transport factor 2 family protein [Rhodoferax sp. U11-2br]MBT3066103.1 tetratricopeptide repeat protein [Rhodoferax sp. U11-2br]
MKQAHNALYKSLRLLVLASACVAASAYADDYADVSQLVRTNKFNEALTRVDSYLASKPGDPQMRFFKGVIQRNLGKTAEAVTTFTQLTQDYPELPEPYNNLAVLYAGQGQYDKAKQALEMAIRTNPSYATAHENLGDVYARLASQAYNKALQLDGNAAAVPPKLALIADVFKPNLNNSRNPVVVAAAASTAAKPAPEPVAAPAAKPAAPATPAVIPSAPVVATAASPATTAAASAPATNNAATTTVAVNADSHKAVEAAVLAWAKAWSSKNMDGYLKAYSPDFAPPGKQSRAAWQQERRDRIVGKKNISVTLSDLNIRVNGEQAVASFRQAYKADSLSIASPKTLNLKKLGSAWLITRESTGR